MCPYFPVREKDVYCTALNGESHMYTVFPADLSFILNPIHPGSWEKQRRKGNVGANWFVSPHEKGEPL